MNQSVFDILRKAGIELKPGQIIWFRSSQSSSPWLTASNLEKQIRQSRGYHRQGIQYQVVEKVSPSPLLKDKIVARRFNLGSLGKYNLLIDDFLDILSFVNVLSDVSSLDDSPIVDLSQRYPSSPGPSSKSSCEIFPSQSYSLMELPEMEPPQIENVPDECCSEKMSECFLEPEKVTKRRKKKSEEFTVMRSIRPSKGAKEWFQPEQTEPDTEDIKDNKEVEGLEKAKDELVKRITAVIVDYVNTTHQMPPMEEIYDLVKGKIVLTPTGLSRLVVNEQLKIYLPDYNELEVSFRPLPLTIYILFLRHLDGIVLNYIGDYARELEEIYSIVMPNRDEKNATKSIRSLTDTLSGSLNQKIAIIKRTFKANILNQEMAAKYYISGSRGEAYKVSLPKEFIQLPSAFNWD